MKALARNAKTELVQELTNSYTERLADLGFRTSRDTVYRWIATVCYTIRRGTEVKASTTPTQLNKWLAEEGGKYAMTEVMSEGIRESIDKFMDVIEMPGAMDVTSGPAQKTVRFFSRWLGPTSANVRFIARARGLCNVHIPRLCAPGTALRG